MRHGWKSSENEGRKIRGAFDEVVSQSDVHASFTAAYLNIENLSAIDPNLRPIIEGAKLFGYSIQMIS